MLMGLSRPVANGSSLSLPGFPGDGVGVPDRELLGSGLALGGELPGAGGLSFPTGAVGPQAVKASPMATSTDTVTATTGGVRRPGWNGIDAAGRLTIAAQATSESSAALGGRSRLPDAGDVMG